MKVLHLDTGHTFRGGQRQVYLLIRGLSKFNVEQHLSCPADSPLVKRVSDYIQGFHPLSGSNLVRFISKKSAKKYIEQNNVDIVHAHDSHAHSLLWFMGGHNLSAKLIVTRRSSGRIGPVSRKKYRIKGIKYIAISEHVKKMLTDGGVNTSAIEVINSMIDEKLFESRSAQKNIGTRSDKIIVSAGAYDKLKGYDNALAAMCLLKEKRIDFKYYLYGDGPEKDNYLNFIKNAGLQSIVTLGGWYNEPNEYISKGDIFLSPSLHEGLNMSIVEAMAMGVPVVASAIPPHMETIKAGTNGILFPPGDFEMMAEEINHLLDDSQMAQKLIAEALTTARKFASKIISEHIYNLYRQIVA